jgi:hypothetical protein
MVVPDSVFAEPTTGLARLHPAVAQPTTLTVLDILGGLGVRRFCPDSGQTARLAAHIARLSHFPLAPGERDSIAHGEVLGVPVLCRRDLSSVAYAYGSSVSKMSRMGNPSTAVSLGSQ